MNVTISNRINLFHPEVLTNGKVAGDKAPPKNLTRVDEHASGWWKSWGKCAAGTIGGAGSGALAGAFLPAVGCTVVLPVIGTVACGTVGDIVGGVSGGLLAAAEFCD